MTVARLGGVPVRLHWSFLLLVVGLVVWTVAIGGAHRVPFLLGGLAALFGSVLAHEVGHTLMAQRLGIRTHEITLLPIGGAARMELRFASPMADLLVSLAGPAVSLILGVVLLALGSALGSELVLLTGGVNLFLGLFNLVPAFPMDGGRVLRALLTKAFGARRANDWTLSIGAVFSVLFVVGGLALSEPGLLAVGVILGAMQARERRMLTLLRRRGKT